MYPPLSEILNPTMTQKELAKKYHCSLRTIQVAKRKYELKNEMKRIIITLQHGDEKFTLTQDQLRGFFIISMTKYRDRFEEIILPILREVESHKKTDRKEGNITPLPEGTFFTDLNRGDKL